jgi:hypothetical protein
MCPAPARRKRAVGLFFLKNWTLNAPAIAAGVRSVSKLVGGIPAAPHTQRVAQRSPDPAPCGVASESGDTCCVGNTVWHHFYTNFEVMQRVSAGHNSCKSCLYIRPTILWSVHSRSVPSYSCRDEFFIGAIRCVFSPRISKLSSDPKRGSRLTPRRSVGRKDPPLRDGEPVKSTGNPVWPLAGSAFLRLNFGSVK